MLPAAFKALSDILSPPFRAVLLKALGLTIALFIAVLVAVEVAISIFAAFPWPWLETVLAVATGLGLFAAFVFLMAPVTALFAGLFLDDVAGLVEQTHYRADPPGRPLDTVSGLVTGLQFGLLVLAVNLALLPLFFFAVGAVILPVVNAYLLGREYFTMIAFRHQSIEAARQLRRDHSRYVWLAGLVPALLALVPIVNFLVPMFATAYFVHVYKAVRRADRLTASSPDSGRYR